MFQLKPQQTDLSRPAYLLTFTCHARRNYLQNAQYRQQIRKQLKEQGEKEQFTVQAISFTPNCLWLIITPFNPSRLKRIIHRFKVKTGRYMREFLELPSPLWEEDPLVRVLTLQEELAARKEYLQTIPTKIKD